MTAQEAKSAEVSQFVDEMVQKGAKLAQTEQQSRHFEIFAKRSRKAAKNLHPQRK